MCDDDHAAQEWNRLLMDLSDDVTDTAYTIALELGVGSCVEMDLGFCKGLARTIRNGPTAA
jgi:hypothetical protein